MVTKGIRTTSTAAPRRLAPHEGDARARGRDVSAPGVKGEAAPEDREHRADQRPAQATYRSRAENVWFWGSLGAVLLWSAFPPLNLWLCGWIAPACWIVLVTPTSLPGRPYRAFYAIALLHWLAVLQWVRLPHWSAYFGWLTLSVYLAVYPVLFLAISRTAHHRLRVPMILACPIVWCGLEYLRGHLFTGFFMAVLGHTQAYRPWIAQCADVAGTIGLGLMIVVVATAVVEAVRRSRRWPWVGLVAGTVALMLGYGKLRSDSIAQSNDPTRTARVALVQGSVDTTFEEDDASRAFDQYLALARDVVAREPNLDLMIWPESMFTSTFPLVRVQSPVQLPEGVEGITASEFERRLRGWEVAFHDKSHWVMQQLNTPLLVGCESIEYGPYRPRRYNSALWIDEQARLRSRYDKMHPVMFGEYVPFGKWFPWLYRFFPMDDGLTPGERPVLVDAGGLKVSPSICFENTVPHLVRRQVRELERNDTEPDVLVTITNDGWFWGSSLLDAHLVSGIFRAIELRKPMLIAANTGFSAVIDPTGQVRQRGPRRSTDVLVADISANSANSLYLQYGDWLGWMTATFVGSVLLAGIVLTRQDRRQTPR